MEAYDELRKQLLTLDEGVDLPEYRKWQDAIKKAVVDSNAVAQETGLSCVLVWVEQAGSAAKYKKHVDVAWPDTDRECDRFKGNIVPAVVEKCLSSNRAGTKQKALDILLAYIDVDTPDYVVVRLR